MLTQTVPALEDGVTPADTSPFCGIFPFPACAPVPVDADPQTLDFFCSGPDGKREFIDSLDADQAAAFAATAGALLSPSGGFLLSPRILTDNRGRPVGLSVLFDDPDIAADLEDASGLQFQLVCLDDRDPVTP